MTAKKQKSPKKAQLKADKPSRSVYGKAPVEEKIEAHTLTIQATNEPGVLARIIGLFTGRGYNIETLTAAETDHNKHLSHITVGVAGTPRVIEQIKIQLERLVAVKKVIDLTVSGPYVDRELALLKVAGQGDHRIEALRIADIFRARVVDSTLDSFIFEVTGTAQKVDAFINLMRPLGLVDVSRTGVAAMARGK